MTTRNTPFGAYRDAHSISAQLHQRALRVMPGGNTRTTIHLDPYPPYAIEGKGTIVVDAEGQERVDFLNNYTSLIHGHADPDVVAAVGEQLGRGSVFGFPTPWEVELAELIVERIPSVDQVRFTNSGTEAVMMALQAARAFTDRPMIAKFEGSYHGSYDFAAVSTSVAPQVAVDGSLPSVPHAKGTPDGVTENVVVLRYNDTEMMERVIEANRSRLAAVIIDLMPWRMGLMPADELFVRRLRDATHAHGILLIFDEVITLRVAYGGMQEAVGVLPDLTTMGKIIGGGFPVGAVGGREGVMAVFDPRGGKPRVPHGGTFTANPMTMIAGLTTMRKLTRDEFTRLDEYGGYLREGLAEALDGARIPGQVTGRGSLFGIHLNDRSLRDYGSWYGAADERARSGQVYAALLQSGVVLAPHLTGCLSTPMTRHDLDAFIESFSESLRALSD